MVSLFGLAWLTLYSPWYSAEDGSGPHAGVDDVIGDGVDAGASDWTRVLSTRYDEVEIAATDSDETWIIGAGERCAANRVCILI